MEINMAVSRLVLLYSLLLFYIISISNGDDEDEEYPIIASITDAIRVNVNHNVTQHLNIVNYSASPNPDITILSPDYFLCIWSYIVKDETNPNLTTYSNEIYSNLFSSKDGKSMVRTEYLLNRIKGYSQDTPSATALFNETNHATHSVAVVWESQIEDSSSSNNDIIDAVYGRIIKWSITFTSSYRYVKVTSPTSQEFQISSPSIDYLHHQNPDVIPIYGTGKFLVSWISSFDGNGDNTKNMVFIRIYYNSGKPYSNQIQIHESDEYYKKYPRAVPLLNNLTLISWLTQSADNGLIVYGMVWDQNGQSRLINNDQGRYTFIEMDDDENHTIYSDTIPVIAHLYNDKYNNNNYFILGWQTRNDQDGTNCIYAAVYMYNDEDNEIIKISPKTPLFDGPYYKSSEYHIEYPQMENVENAIYEQEYGLDAKVALCYSLKDIKLDKSDIYCKILEITLWDNQETVDAEINLVTEEKMINTNSQLGHQHEHPQISSESALRARVDFNDNPEFVVVWSNQRQTGYDIYTRIMKLSDTEEIYGAGDGDGDESNDTGIFGPKFNIIVIGVVFGIILVVLCVCLCNHFYKKHKDNSINRPRNKMQQIGEESDDDNEDTIGQIGYGGHETIGHDDDDDDDDDVDYGIDTGDGIQLTNQDSVTR